MTHPSQDAFIAGRQETWRELEGLLLRNRWGLRDAEVLSRTASCYRTVCGDLMLARARGYTPDLVDDLDRLAVRASHAVYRPDHRNRPRVAQILVRDFPATVRRRIGFMLLATMLFGLPAALGLVGTLASAGFAEQVLPSEQLAAMAEMYSQGFDAGRPEGIDTMMFGHYVNNNIGIAFRCFATGILLGTGSMFFLVYNGLTIGTTVGHVIHAGHGANILTFICSHGPFELTAIVISGAAGIQMGYALVETRGRTRLGSLRAQSYELVCLVLGAAVMLLIAAMLEGYWSPSHVSPVAKWIASAVGSAALVLYFAFAGRLAPVEVR